MATYKARAISLKTSPFAEADKLVTLFTRQQGKVSAIAKGARRVPSSLGGRVEPFTFADYFIARGRNLDIISQAEVLETFQFVREQEMLLPSAVYMLKLVDSGTAMGQPYSELFDLLLFSLKKFKGEQNPREIAKDFERDFVILEGLFKEGIDPQYTLSDHLGKDLRTW